MLSDYGRCAALTRHGSLELAVDHSPSCAHSPLCQCTRRYCWDDSHVLDASRGSLTPVCRLFVSCLILNDKFANEIRGGKIAYA